MGCVLIDVARRHRAARGFRLRQPAISLALVVPCRRRQLVQRAVRMHNPRARQEDVITLPAFDIVHRLPSPCFVLPASGPPTFLRLYPLEGGIAATSCDSEDVWMGRGGLRVTQCANESATLTAGHDFGLLGITISCVTASGVTAGPTVALLGVLGLVVYALI